MVFTFVNGLPLIQVSGVHQEPWFIAKFALLFLMLHYHFKCSRIMMQLSHENLTQENLTQENFSQKSFKKENFKMSSKSLRVFNEIITVIMAAIVSLAIFKDIATAAIYFICFIVLITILFMSAKFFRKK